MLTQLDDYWLIPSDKLTVCYLGKSTNSMAIFNSKLLVYQRVAVNEED